ncbi:MAG: CDP-glucose 4,6-dehydratase [Proteobacteria bacterium]|nr:CDP-glucose 4,6-dehydratase [Pseudomonadota bacterium]
MEGLVSPSPAFWRGKRVLITGHTGFKGGWLGHWLARLGASVTGFALAPETEPNLFTQSRLGERVASTIGDVRELAAVRRAAGTARPEIILHLAAQSLVRRSYADPVGTFATNVLGTAHVLEVARALDGVRVILSVTSDKCYLENGGGAAYRESDPLGGGDPYSASKACAELVTAAYRQAFSAGGTPAVASARAGNVIGGGDWAPDRLVPDCIRAFAAGRPVEIRNPRAVRPWQHVLEPLAGYLLLAERLWRDPGVAEAWNFGPADTDARPVAALVDELARLWGTGARWTAQPGDHPHEAPVLRLDSAKACARLGWAPRLGLDQALDWTVEWYRRAQAGEAAAALVDAQIAAYEARA